MATGSRTRRAAHWLVLLGVLVAASQAEGAHTGIGGTPREAAGVAGAGAHRLEVTVRRSGRRICFGSEARERPRFRSPERCFREDRRPVLVSYGLAGGAEGTTEWVSLVGAVGPRGARVVAVRQDGSERALALRALGRGTRAFALTAGHRHLIPRTLEVIGADGRTLRSLEIDPSCCPGRSVPTLSRADRRRALAIARSDAALRRVLAGRV